MSRDQPTIVLPVLGAMQAPLRTGLLSCHFTLDHGMLLHVCGTPSGRGPDIRHTNKTAWGWPQLLLGRLQSFLCTVALGPGSVFLDKSDAYSDAFLSVLFVIFVTAFPILRVSLGWHCKHWSVTWVVLMLTITAAQSMNLHHWPVV